MPSAQVSVAQAAEILGVHEQRVYQRIREGSLPAERIGHQWVVEMNEVRRVSRSAVPGRPLSARSVWDIVAVAAGDLSASRLRPSPRSRARSRLRNLLSRVSSEAPDAVADHLAHALRNRAERVLVEASPRDLPDVRADERVHPSGVSRPESNMSAGDVVEGYVAAEDLDDLVADYLLSAAPRARANVVLHVVPSGSEHPSLADLATSPLVLAADLAEHDGVRERHEAVRVIAHLDAELVRSGQIWESGRG